MCVCMCNKYTLLFDLNIKFTIFVAFTYARNKCSALHKTKTAFLKGTLSLLLYVFRKLLFTNYWNYLFIHHFP